MGGMKFIKESSNGSLKKVDDYIVYLDVVHGSNPDHQKGMAFAIAGYPEMEGRADFAMKNAKSRPRKLQRRRNSCFIPCSLLFPVKRIIPRHCRSVRPASLSCP